MRLPPGWTRAFEAAGKQVCIWGMANRKYGASFSSRQGVYEALVPIRGLGQFVPMLPLMVTVARSKGAVSAIKMKQGGIATKEIIPP